MKPQRQHLSLPIDLIIEIFLKLPAKSIARCRCVSKLWTSVLRRQEIIELFLSESSSRTQLLFACQGTTDLSFFSTQQPRNPNDVVTANHLAHFPCKGKFSAPVNGFFCLRLEEEKILNCRQFTELVSVICNPSTGQSFSLPKLKTKRRRGLCSYMGYDPVEKQLKVLSMTWLSGNWRFSEEHQVMTLGTNQSSQEMVECCIPHLPIYHYGRYGSAICINGVLFFKTERVEDSMIVSFDFRSKEFNVLLKFKEAPGTYAMPYSSVLVNYNGKLGFLRTDDDDYYVNRRSKSFELWILEDGRKQEWSKHRYELPTSWEDVVKETELYFVGIIGTNEIVLAPRYQSLPYHILYYSTERKTITRVEIQGSEAFKDWSVRTFLNYVDNVMFLPEL